MKPADFKKKFRDLGTNPRAVITVIIIALLLDAAVFLRGQLVSVKSLFVRTAALKKTLTTAWDDSRFLAKNKNMAQDLEDGLARLNKRVMREEELAAILESISKFAGSSAVRILNIKPLLSAGQKTPAEGFSRQKIFITAKAGFHQLGHFIALIENSNIFLDIKSLEITADVQEYGKEQVNMVLEVVLRPGA